ARLKHLAIFPRKVDFSCFGYHPDLESRLTFQEKWVLVLAPEIGPLEPVMRGAWRPRFNQSQDIASNLASTHKGNRMKRRAIRIELQGSTADGTRAH
ncbi:hypothetical protein, partial [Bradyrhizobium sp. Mp27]|uniref:hypothetical protein n=1 Tax=Bradyrhizobium sp. Mp27 TaxID=3042157 RepID=UPI00248AEABF